MPATTVDRKTAAAAIQPIDATFVPVDVTPVAGGDNRAVFDVRSRDERHLIIKTYSDELHRKMRKELFAYGLLEPARSAVPLATILTADDSKRVLDRNYLVMTKLEGTLLYRVIDDLEPGELDVIDRETGAALAAMHEVKIEAFGYLGQDGVGDPYDTNRQYMTAQFAKKLSDFDSLGADAVTSRAVLRYLDAHLDLLDACSGAVFCHDDCHEGNILVSKGPDGWHVSGVLDLENAIAGDPLLDLAKTEAYRRRRSERRLQALVDGCGAMRPDWRAALDLYTLYHWLELWGWFAAHDRVEPLSSLSASIRRICDASS
jgi:aminoglycoside phosphotransferase (APT) family kinase protein